VFSKLRATAHEVVDISQRQMTNFAGNMLELASANGNLIVLSSTALGSLEPAQRRALESHGGLLPVPIPTVERVGGGGVRCMLAEIHLPKRNTASAASAP
jgi:hypothetical protein